MNEAHTIRKDGVRFFMKKKWIVVGAFFLLCAVAGAYAAVQAPDISLEAQPADAADGEYIALSAKLTYRYQYLLCAHVLEETEDMPPAYVGSTRQELHEHIRTHSMAAAQRIKQGDGVNDLLDRIAADPAFGVSRERLESVLEPSLYVGRAPEQTREFIAEEVEPVRRRYADELGVRSEITL